MQFEVLAQAITSSAAALRPARYYTRPFPDRKLLMQTFTNLMPLAAFLLAYYLRDIYTATATLMVTMVLVLVIDYVRLRKVTPMHLLSTVLVLVFGTATLLLRDPRFLKWKPSIFMWMLALAFLLSQWIGKAPLAQRMLQAALPDAAQIERGTWLRVNLAWVACYAALGAANLWVAYTFSERFWVNFKVFGLTAALMAFAMLQALWLNGKAAPR
jgi:intracellular septation protein